VCGKD
jgi:hypothetical protein